jgi:probable HAF family extracellular repeat protein
MPGRTEPRAIDRRQPVLEKSTWRRAWGSLAAFVMASSVMAPAAAATYYVVEDLGALAGDNASVAFGINRQGDVVGWSSGGTGHRAFVYTDGAGMVALAGLPDRPRTLARRINDAGDIVGTADAGGTDGGHAVRWRGGVIQDIGTLGAGTFSEGWGINNDGDVVGRSSTQGGSAIGVHAFLYSDRTGLVDLTPDSDTGIAMGINDAGQVTGYKTAVGGYHAFRWTNGGFLDLGVLPGFAHSFGFAIDATGRVAGSSSSASGNAERLFRFTDGVGMQDLGGVGEHNTAWGINGAGTVVGATGQSQSRAFVHTDQAGLQDLNTLIDRSLGWVLLAAYDINDGGQIAGQAFNNFTGKTHAVRLQPTSTRPPECSFHCLRSTAISLTTSRRRGTTTVHGNVTVRDETGAAVAQALVAVTWKLPNGTTQEHNVWTARNGEARFSTSPASPGTYTLSVTGIVKSLYTFNPSRSVLSKSITVVSTTSD